MLVLSIFSDISHAVAIKIFRFVKMSWKGKSVSSEEIHAEFSEFGKYSTLEPFRRWLAVNKRSDGAFLKSSSTYIEMGLQKCVSFWPHLVVNFIEPTALKPVNTLGNNLSSDPLIGKELEPTSSAVNDSRHVLGTEVNPSSVDVPSNTSLNASTAVASTSCCGCTTTLIWAERHMASKWFKDDSVSIFVPSFNAI
jgi:hypothetical protein